jgi:ubiquinone/menaquinone biosynthesis C-methylase UbiE
VASKSLAGERTRWSDASHESAVERFYAHGASSQTEVHGGFLNFGLWEGGVESYLDAAHNLVARMADLLGLHGDSRLLDVACGMGAQDLHLSRCFPGIEVDALDVTWKHVERARRRAEQAGVSTGVRFHHGSATQLPFENDHFTHVMSIEGPEHFQTRRDFFAEARRVLRPGGVMALADYSITREARSPLEWHLVDLSRRLWKIPRENVWTAERYRKELIAAGFVDASVESVGALTFPGYYREQCQPAYRAEMRRIQGSMVEWLGHWIDVVTNLAYERGLVDYLLVRAVEPG